MGKDHLTGIVVSNPKWRGKFKGQITNMADYSSIPEKFYAESQPLSVSPFLCTNPVGQAVTLMYNHKAVPID